MARKNNNKKSNKTGNYRKDDRKNNGNYPNPESGGRSRGDNTDDRNRAVPDHNDPSFYTTSPQLTRDVASIPFNWPIGTGISPAIHNPSNTAALDPYAISGIMTIETLHGPGQSKGPESAVNIAARTMYEFVRHQNSGAKNYDPADLEMYLLSMGEAVGWFAHLVRAYGIAMVYNQKSRYYPKYLLDALGFDSKDIMENLAQFRYEINKFARQIGSLCIPKDITYFVRLMFIYGNYFIDGTTPKAQIYAMVPYVIRAFDDTYELGSQLSPISYQKELGGNAYQLFNAARNTDNAARLNIAAIRSISNTIADCLLGSEDIGIMGGDILKAYGQDGLATISMISEDFALLPTPDTEILHQIMNGTYWLDFEEVNITQDPSIDVGLITYFPAARIKGSWVEGQGAAETDICAMSSGDKLFNFYHEDPTPEEILYSSRLCSTVEWETDASEFWTSFNLKAYLDGFGTEACGRLHIWTTTIDKDTRNISGLDHIDMVTYNSAFTQYAYFWLSAAAKLAQFNYHPTIYFPLFVSASDPDIEYGPNMFQQVENYTLISDDLLKRMHEAAILSMWRVPQLGLYSG